VPSGINYEIYKDGYAVANVGFQMCVCIPQGSHTAP